MDKIIICGFNGIPFNIDEGGNLLSVATGTFPTESEHNDGYYTESLLLGINNNALVPILINDDGELIL